MRSLAHIPSKTVTSGYRAIKDGSRYNPYFPPPDERDRVIIDDGEVTDRPVVLDIGVRGREMFVKEAM